MNETKRVKCVSVVHAGIVEERKAKETKGIGVNTEKHRGGAQRLRRGGTAIALLLAERRTFPGEDQELLGRRAGSWRGNRIAIVGLYDDPLPGRKENLFEVITGMGSEGYANISIEAVEMVRAYLAAFRRP